MKTDTSLCAMYVMEFVDGDLPCYGVDISTCNWKGCSTSARALDLSFSELKGDLSIIGTLKNLEYLEIGENKLTGSIAKISGLKKITDMYVENNQLTGPIASLASLTKLTDLDVSHNR